MKKTKKKHNLKGKKILSDKVGINAILGINCLYIPMKESDMVYTSRVPIFPVTLLIPKSDTATVNKLRKHFKSHADNISGTYTVEEEKRTYSPAGALSKLKAKKFIDGDDSEYEQEHGHYLLRTNCYEAPPATGRVLKDGTVEAEKVKPGEEGYIQRGDKVKVALSIYFNKNHASLQVKILAVYLIEKGENATAPKNVRLRHEMALKQLGLKPSQEVGEQESENSYEEWDEKTAKEEEEQTDQKKYPDDWDDLDDDEDEKPKKKRKKRVKQIEEDDEDDGSEDWDENFDDEDEDEDEKPKKKRKKRVKKEEDEDDVAW